VGIETACLDEGLPYLVISGIKGIGTDRTKASVLVMESADRGKQIGGIRRGVPALRPFRVDVSPKRIWAFQGVRWKMWIPITRTRRVLR